MTRSRPAVTPARPMVPLPELRARRAGNRRAITHTQDQPSDKAPAAVRGTGPARPQGHTTTRPARDADTYFGAPPRINVMQLPVYQPAPDKSITRPGALDYRRHKSRGIG